MRQKVQPYKGYNVIDVRVTVCSPAKKKNVLSTVTTCI